MGPLRGVRHVCFDKDGTLTDLHSYWDPICRLRARTLCERYGLDASNQDVLLECMGLDPRTGRLRAGGPVGRQPRRVIVESLRLGLRRLGTEAGAEDIGSVLKDIDRRQQETDDFQARLLPGVEGVLDSFRREGIALSVYSSDRKENCAAVLDRLGLSGYFAAIVGGGCVQKPKPDPEGFLTACRLCGVGPAESAYVGDTPEDLCMGLAAGAAAAVGIASGMSEVSELLSAAPHVYPDMDALLNAFKSDAPT